MKIIFILPYLQFLLPLISSGQVSEEKLVKEVFDNYNSEMRKGNGEEALKYIDEKSVNYYNNINDLIKTGDSSKINSLPIFDKITIFVVRMKISKTEILSMTGSGLFIYIINHNMPNKRLLGNNEINTIVIDKEFATGRLVLGDKKIGQYCEFHKESGQWKINLTHLFDVGNLAYIKLVQDSGSNENKYLLTLLKKITGQKPGAEIWQPISK